MSWAYPLFGGEYRRLGRSLQHVLGGDDEAPSRPDETGAHQGEVLRKGQLLGGTGQIGDACQDESPLFELLQVSKS